MSLLSLGKGLRFNIQNVHQLNFLYKFVIQILIYTLYGYPVHSQRNPCNNRTENQIANTIMELQQIEHKIYEIRGQKVMLDFDLAELYNTETRILNQSVKRNIERFPDDFMFQLKDYEWFAMSSQFVMTSKSKRPKTSLPFVFTEHCRTDCIVWLCH